MVGIANLVLFLLVMVSNAGAMQPGQPPYRRFTLPEYNARAPEYENGVFILHSKDGTYGLPRILNARVVLAEDTHPISNFFRKRRHLVIEISTNVVRSNGTERILPEKLVMSPGPALWKSGVSWSIEETTYADPWARIGWRDRLSYTLDVRGDPDKVAQLEARLRLGTFEPFFENRLHTAFWVNQVIGYETDARSVTALSHSAGNCIAGSAHLDVCEKGGEWTPDRQTVYYSVPFCMQLPASGTLAGAIHLTLPLPDTVTFTSRNCAKKATPAASVLEVARFAAFVDAVGQVGGDGLSDTITGEVRVPALVWFTAGLKLVD